MSVFGVVSQQQGLDINVADVRLFLYRLSNLVFFYKFNLGPMAWNSKFWIS